MIDPYVEDRAKAMVAGVMVIVEGAYRRGTLAPDYVHLVRADIDLFIRAMLHRQEEIPKENGTRPPAEPTP